MTPDRSTSERLREAWRRIGPIGLTLGLMASAIGFQLFVPPIVGLSETGDMRRNVVFIGLEYPKNFFTELRGFVIPEFILSTPTLQTGDQFNQPAYTSEGLFGALARIPAGLFSKTQRFDIRWAGLVHLTALLLGVLAALLAVSRLLSRPMALLAAGLATAFMFTDVGYVSYLNSLYGDAASLAALALFTGTALGAALRPNALKWTMMYVVAAAILITAKAQNTLLVIPAVYFLWRLSALRLDRSGQRASGLAGLVLIALSFAVYHTGQPGVLRKSSLYQTVFNGILHESPTPKEDLADLGLPTDWSVYARQDYWVGERSPRTDPEFDRVFFADMSFSKVALFYVRHPGHLLDIAVVAGRRAHRLRMPYLGNFTRDAGFPAYTQSGAFDIWSWVKPHVLPGSLLSLSLTCALWTGFALRRRRDADAGVALTADLALVLVATLCIQFLTSILAEGLSVIDRHLFLFNATFDVLVIGSIALLLQKLPARNQAPSS